MASSVVGTVNQADYCCGGNCRYSYSSVRNRILQVQVQLINLTVSMYLIQVMFLMLKFQTDLVDLVLQTDGAGNLSWSVADGGGNGQSVALILNCNLTMLDRLVVYQTLLIVVEK
jgi:hypothetical protein